MKMNTLNHIRKWKWGNSPGQSCEPAMSCCKPNLTLQAEKCWDNVQQQQCQKPICRKLFSSQRGATCNAQKCPSFITWCKEKGQTQSDKHQRCTLWYCVCSRAQLLWVWAKTWVIPKHLSLGAPRTWPALLLQWGQSRISGRKGRAEWLHGWYCTLSGEQVYWEVSPLTFSSNKTTSEFKGLKKDLPPQTTWPDV